MEEDLNFFKNGRQPQLFQKWNTTSIFSIMEDDLNFSKMEDNLNFLGKKRYYIPSTLLNSKPNPSTLGLCTAQVMGLP